MITDARCVIVGGGVLGCAAAYQLARAGLTDVLLIEQGDLAGGTTAWGAGLIGQVRASVAKVRLIMRSRQMIQELHDEGFNPDWHPVGSLRVSLTAARDAEFEHLAQSAAEVGLEARFIAPAEAQRLVPGLALAEARRLLWCPRDGYVSAPALARAYAESAQRRGVRFATGRAVRGFRFDDNRRVAGVLTSAGDVSCETVVVAVGAMAARLGQLAGLSLPIFPVRHQSLVTTPIADFHSELPVVRIPDARLYVRPYESAALIGAFTERAFAQEAGAVGDPYPQAQPDTDELDLMMREGRRFFPALAGARIAAVRRGLPTCTPDGTTLLGPVPGIPGLYLAAGCQAHGVAASGGMATLLAEAILQGRLPAAARAYDPARWGNRTWEPDQARRAAELVLQNYYTLPEVSVGRAAGDRLPGAEQPS